MSKMLTQGRKNRIIKEITDLATYIKKTATKLFVNANMKQVDGPQNND